MVDQVYTNLNPNNVLGEPDDWLIINVNGNDRYIPAYA
jgi:hypothetical protein